MQEDTQVKPGQFVLTVSEGGGDLPDYELLEAEEPIKANITDIRNEMGKQWTPDEPAKPQLRFIFKVAEGQPGAGQTYSKWVNAPQSNKISPKSALYKDVIAKAFPDQLPEGFELTTLLGAPVRIELSAPYQSGDNTRQKIAVIKSPVKDQKKLDVSTTPNELDTDEIAAFFTAKE